MATLSSHNEYQRVDSSYTTKETIRKVLTGWWEMDEFSAGTGLVTRVDSHGSIDLTDNGGLYVASVEDSDIGTAAHFVNTLSDGAGASNLYNDTAANVHSPLGFSAWAWIVPYYLDNWSYILAKTDNGSSSITTEAWAMGIAGDDTFFSRVISGNVDNIRYSTEVAATNTPYFLCMVYDRHNQFHGISVNGGALQTSAITGLMDNDGDTFNVGRRGFTSNRMYFMGAMNRAGFAHSPLDAKQISWLYNSGSGRSYAEITA